MEGALSISECVGHMAAPQRQSQLNTRAECEAALRAMKASRGNVPPRRVMQKHTGTLSTPLEPAYFVTTDAATLMNLTPGAAMPNPKWRKAVEQFEGHDVYIYDKPGYTERYFDVPPERIFDAEHFSAGIQGAG